MLGPKWPISLYLRTRQSLMANNAISIVARQPSGVLLDSRIRFEEPVRFHFFYLLFWCEFWIVIAIWMNGDTQDQVAIWNEISKAWQIADSRTGGLCMDPSAVNSYRFWAPDMQYCHTRDSNVFNRIKSIV